MASKACALCMLIFQLVLALAIMILGIVVVVLAPNKPRIKVRLQQDEVRTVTTVYFCLTILDYAFYMFNEWYSVLWCGGVMIMSPLLGLGWICAPNNKALCIPFILLLIMAILLAHTVIALSVYYGLACVINTETDSATFLIVGDIEEAQIMCYLNWAIAGITEIYVILAFITSYKVCCCREAMDFSAAQKGRMMMVQFPTATQPPPPQPGQKGYVIPPKQYGQRPTTYSPESSLKAVTPPTAPGAAPRLDHVPIPPPKPHKMKTRKTRSTASTSSTETSTKDDSSSSKSSRSPSRTISRQKH